MRSQDREIRVFLSSTFQDMDAERRHLVKVVFPRVRAACHARRVGFTDIDLRWGVTEVEARNGATVAICLQEIERCRDFPPFFLGFLGERYGWVPRLDELAAYWAHHAADPLALVIRDAVERGVSVTELEMELAVLGRPEAPAALTSDEAAGRVLFLLRDPSLTATLQAAAPGGAAFADESGGRLAALKARIRQAGLPWVDGYTSIAAFGAAVEQHLFTALDHFFPADAVPSAAEQVEAAQAAFRFGRLQHLVPRPDVRDAVRSALAARVATPYLGPLVLGGPSGQGKSAMLAALAHDLETAPALGDVVLRPIDHYVGADGQLTLGAWIDRLLHRLHPTIADLTGPVPTEAAVQIEALPTWLAYAARREEQMLADAGQPRAQVRYLLLLDALDQLADGGRDLSVLTRLGADALLVVSVADGTVAAAAMQGWARITVPPLDTALRTTIIGDTLARYRKTLPPTDVVRLAAAPQTGSPLFLRLALEELRVDAQHATLSATVDTILAAPDPESLLLETFLLDPDTNRPGQPLLAVWAMALLGASRQGLAEAQLGELLALPGDPIAEDTGAPRLPRAVLSQLMLQLAPFLLSKEDRRAPMHRRFGEAALRYLGDATVRDVLLAYADRPTGDPAEVLYQRTVLARTPGPRQAVDQARLATWLVAGVHLHPEHEALVSEALRILPEEKLDELVTQWVALAGTLTPLSLDAEWERVLTLGRFLERAVIQQYHAARRVLTALHGRMQYASAPPQRLEDVALALADVLGQFAAHAEVEALERAVVEARIARLGPDHPDTLGAMGNLALTLHAHGDLDAARLLQEQELAASRRVLGPEHPATLRAMSNLAYTLSTQGELIDARNLEEPVVEIHRRVLGPEHPDTLRAMGNLAATLYSHGDMSGARTLGDEVLDVRRRVLGPEHPDTLTAMGNLAVTLRDLGDLIGARDLEEQVLETRRRVLGPEHPATLVAMGNLAVSLRLAGDVIGAFTLAEEALAVSRRLLGPEHPDTLWAMGNLARALKARGDLVAGNRLAKEVFSIHLRLHGPDHPDTLEAAEFLERFRETDD